jgi:hypothetical protein
MTDDERRDRALEIGASIRGNALANHLLHDALGHAVEGRPTEAHELVQIAAGLVRDAPNYFERITRSHPDPSARWQVVVDETCGHRHSARGEAESCDSGSGYVLERTADGDDVAIY